MEKDRRLQVLGWASLAILLLLGVYFFFWLPTVGKGGLLLAIVATLMPLVWEQHGWPLRSAWLLTLFLFFGVEYRAIDKERADFIREQQASRQEERDSFKKLEDDQRHALKDILDGEARNLKYILGSEQKNFDRTLRANRVVQDQERRDFLALLSKQQELYEFSAGQMLPANDPMPMTCGKIPDNRFVIKMRDTVVSVGSLPVTVLRVAQEPVISLSKTASGNLVMSMELRGEDGRILAKLDQNGWIANPVAGLMMERDKHGIRLFDSYGNELLNARFLNKQAFSIYGSIPYRGRVIPLPVLRGCLDATNVDTVIAIQ